jgi:hypothetical protein
LYSSETLSCRLLEFVARGVGIELVPLLALFQGQPVGIRVQSLLTGKGIEFSDRHRPVSRHAV